MSRRLLILLALLVPVGLSTWLLHEPSAPTLRVEQPSTEPDYFLRGMHSIQTDDKGRLYQSIRAARLTHYPHNEEVVMEAPWVELHQLDGSRWQMAAQHGLLTDQQQELHLHGAVRIEHLDTPRPLRLETERLVLWPDREYAETDAQVRLFSPGSELLGTGMQLFGEQQRLILLSEVRGIHADTTP